MNQNIEGLPPGTKLKAFVQVQHAVCDRDRMDYTLDMAGKPVSVMWARERYTKYAVIPIIEPDNIYGAVDLNAVPIPDGFERAGDTPKEWFRSPLLDESFLSHGGRVDVNGNPDGIWETIVEPPERIILRKVKRIKRVLVAEWDIDETAGPYASTAPNFDVAQAVAFAVNRPDRYRTEERKANTTPPTIERDPKPVAFDLLAGFAHYCAVHNKMRFWQALSGWSEGSILHISDRNNGMPQDTFHWKGRNS